MKKNTLLIIALFAFTFLGFKGAEAQIVQDVANWPNAAWDVTGSYSTSGFASDPRTTPNFSWDDDAAGSGSNSDVIQAESPMINLNPAFTGGEQQIQVSFNYVYRRVGDYLSLQWWNQATNTWEVWEVLSSNSSNTDYKTCTAMQTFVSAPLTIATFSSLQMTNFRYRIQFDDGGFDWGFCMESPTLESIVTPPCFEVSNITIDPASITADSAVIDWTDNNTTAPLNGWDIEYGITGFTQGSGTIINAALHPFTLSGLNANETYDVYIRALCTATEQSGWFGPISFTTATIPVGCGGQFVDSGGDNGQYTVNENIITTLCPDVAGEVVTVQFLSFDTESCCDHLTIYDGPDTTFPSLGTYQGTDLPPTFTATDASGCLTFEFISDVSQQGDGWVANIICGPPPTCFAPTNILVSNETQDGAEFTWTDNNTPPPANGWEVVIVLQGQDPATGNPVTVTTLPYVVTGLNSSSAYDFYVTAICDDGGTTDPSFQSGPLTFSTLVAPPSCGSPYVDSGGPANNYSNNEDQIYTICPDNVGDVVTLQFLTFDIENNWDFLSIYDGNSTAAPLVGTYTGTNMPPIITSTSADGCLTVHFTSDTIISREGWTANVICGPAPTCSIPSNIVVNNITNDSAEISWTDNNTPPPANGWEVEIVPAGTAPTGVGVAVAASPYLVTGLTQLTGYDVYIRAVCDDGGNVDPSFWLGPVNFETQVTPPSCGGLFTDTGGENGNYSNGEDSTITICPDVVGDVVSIEFLTFNTESCCDNLTVYDGSDATAPLLGVYAGTDIPPVFVSSDPSGCLTFVFHSDGSVTREGWTANVNCGPPPSCWFVTAFATGATTVDSIELIWTDNNNSPNPPLGGYNIEFGPTGFTQGTGTIVNAPSSPFVVTGLLSSTNYDFYVQASCAADGSDSSDWVGPVNERTDDAPPPNDTCITAIPLPVTLGCTPTIGNNVLATDSTDVEGEVMPNCADPAANGAGTYEALDVWYSFVVPNTGTVTVETSNTGGMVDTVLAAYSGTCGNLVELDCQDDSVINQNSADYRFSSITLMNLPIGDTIYLRVWSYPAYTSAGSAQQNIQGSFGICVYGQSRSWNDTLGLDENLDSDISLSYYPNPVTDTLSLHSEFEINDVKIFNTLGQLVINKEFNVETNDVSIDMNNLSSATYFVRVNVQGETKTFTVIKD